MSTDTTAPPATLPDILAALRELGDRLATLPAGLLTRETFAALLDVGTRAFDKLREAGRIGPRPTHVAGLQWHRDGANERYDATARLGLRALPPHTRRGRKRPATTGLVR